MTSRGALKSIAPVPTASDFLDIVLSGTQRRTPTVVRKGWKITRIRSFYMRKVKFTAETFTERLQLILTEFPVLDSLHPFLSSLLNVLYDKSHYKLALSQLNTAKNLIEQVGKDYLRLLKFGDSLYRCKQLKRAGLGRMATIMRRQKDSLAYLEQVRQHMSRLPAIDPATRTLIICGYPNVGKSSFLNKVTRADVDVQPYAFTTKSLFVGHLDYKYLRWQVIDTPGILDRPLEEMNTIEMQSITALAHLRASVMYFMDLSEQCGYSVADQVKLFQSIRPLFSGKPTFIVINKIDVCRPSDLPQETQDLLNSLTTDEEFPVQILQLSCHSAEGVMDVRNAACEALLTQRVENKEKSKRAEALLGRLRVAVPTARDEVERLPHIPDAVVTRKKYDKNDPDRMKLEKDLELEGAGAGAYSVDMKKYYLLGNEEWKYDNLPEVKDGKNIADFIDVDILRKLEELELEEERLQQEGYYDDEDEKEMDDSDTEAIRSTATLIREKKAEIRLLNSSKDKKQNRSIIPRSKQTRTLDEMTSKLRQAGYDPSNLEERAKIIAKAKGLIDGEGKKRKRDEDEGDRMEVDNEDDGWGSTSEESADDMEVDGESRRNAKRQKGNKGTVVHKGKRVPGKNRATSGMSSETQIAKANRLKFLSQRKPNRMARAGEADRHVASKMPKHLFTGKRKMGKTNRR